VVGLIFVISGLFIFRGSLAQIQLLWTQFSPYLPFSAPPDIGRHSQNALPIVFTNFVCMVASISGFVIGAVWIISGLAEMLKSRNAGEPDELDNPEKIVETVRTRTAVNVNNPFPVRMLARVWAPAGFTSAVSSEMIVRLITACFRIIILGLAIWAVGAALRLMPSIIKSVAGMSVSIPILSTGSLYSLLLLVILFNAGVILSLIPLKAPPQRSHYTELPVSGAGNPTLFFTLIEESCKLLSPKGAGPPPSVRLEAGASARATLIESTAGSSYFVPRPAGLLCLPIILYCTVSGFSRLIHINRAVGPIPYQEFLTLQLPNYLVDVAFAVGLILAGLYVAEWARRLFDIRRYESYLIFVYSMHPTKNAAKNVVWSRIEGADEDLVNWAKSTSKNCNFSAKFVWGRLVSEASGSDPSRYFLQIQDSHELNASMQKIVDIPFQLGFKKDRPEEGAVG
jgi:hypothetical protein